MCWSKAYLNRPFERKALFSRSKLSRAGKFILFAAVRGFV
jgi:hypothetical protein